jgi:hypothetical protein
MKTTLLLLLCLVAPIVSPREITSKQLIGHWRWADTSRSIDYVFLDDGTFTGSATQEGTIIAEFTGNWSLERDLLNYEYTSDSSGRAPVGAKDQDKLLEVTTDYYVIQTRTGAKRKYVRVK